MNLEAGLNAYILLSMPLLHVNVLDATRLSLERIADE